MCDASDQGLLFFVNLEDYGFYGSISDVRDLCARFRQNNENLEGLDFGIFFYTTTSTTKTTTTPINYPISKSMMLQVCSFSDRGVLAFVNLADYGFYGSYSDMAVLCARFRQNLENLERLDFGDFFDTTTSTIKTSTTTTSTTTALPTTITSEIRTTTRTTFSGTSTPQIIKTWSCSKGSCRMRFDEKMSFAEATKMCKTRNSLLPLPTNQQERIQFLEYGPTWIDLMVNQFLSKTEFADWQPGYRGFMNSKGALVIANSKEQMPFTCVKKGTDLK